tara:strand:+ start:347 stop:568 length:222 start_codon:yes stop_codon:yes gene_type:complete
MSWITEKLTQIQAAFNAFIPEVPGHSHQECSHSTSVDFNTLKVTELKAIAKERGLTGYTSLRKAQLIEMLEQN